MNLALFRDIALVLMVLAILATLGRILWAFIEGDRFLQWTCGIAITAALVALFSTSHLEQPKKSGTRPTALKALT